jgi:hypothetical protein
MPVVAAVLFALAAVGGLGMAWMRIGQERDRPPTGLALLHGTFAAAGLVVYLIAVIGGAPWTGIVAIILFVLAAGGGAYLFFGFHRRGAALPVPVVVGHGSIAVVAFVFLLLAIAGIGAGGGGSGY